MHGECKGKSSFSHNYDFAIQRSKHKPDSQLVIFLNDSNSISKGLENGFANYNVNTIRWSERQSKNNINILSA